MEQNVTEDGDGDTQHSVYMLFLLVLVFFVMGLVGFLICHILKKKGYRCRTFRDELEPDNKEPLTPTEDGEWEGGIEGGWLTVQEGVATFCNRLSPLIWVPKPVEPFSVMIKETLLPWLRLS